MVEDEVFPLTCFGFWDFVLRDFFSLAVRSYQTHQILLSQPMTLIPQTQDSAYNLASLGETHHKSKSNYLGLIP